MCNIVMKSCILLVVTVLILKTDAGLTNFETSSRDWFNDLFRDDLDWQLHRGQLPNRHGRGNYLYLTTSTSNGKSAILESRILRTPIRGSCVSFWYRISGKNPGGLKLKRMEMTGPKIRTKELWLREGDQGRAWNFARVSIPPNPHTRYYQIIIESKLGSGRGGVVALDNIDLDANHPCSNSLENGGFVVDFETKVTAMKNKRYGDHFDWVITKSRASRSGIGPSHDVTSGIGHYLHLSTKGKTSGQRASYSSNPVPGSRNGACLSFYYYMHDEGVGKLTVSILRRSGWVSTAKSVWSKTGSVDDGWRMARVSLANSLTMQRYDVMFTGTVGKGALGDIALDDITLINTGICK